MTDYRAVDFVALRNDERREHADHAFFLLGLTLSIIVVLVLAFCILNDTSCRVPSKPSPAIHQSTLSTRFTLALYHCLPDQLQLPSGCWSRVYQQPHLTPRGDIHIERVPSTWLWPRGRHCPPLYIYTENDTSVQLFRNPTCKPSPSLKRPPKPPTNLRVGGVQ